MRSINRLLSGVFASAIAVVFFCTLPSDPKKDPARAEVTLFSTVSGVVTERALITFGLEVIYPEHFESISISSSCGNHSLTISPDSLNDIDTVYFPVSFSSIGSCTLYAVAVYNDSKLKDKKSEAPVYIIAGKPLFEFASSPGSFSTHCGTVDTLTYKITMAEGSTSSPNVWVSSQPLLPENELFVLGGIPPEPVRVVFDAAITGNYNVCLHAKLPSSAHEDVFEDSVCISVNAFRPIVPAVVVVPKTVSGRTKDTIRFVIDNTGREDPQSIELIRRSTMDTTFFSIIKETPESLYIVILPGATRNIDFAVRLTNGVVSDTIPYSIEVAPASPEYWKNTEVEIDVKEGSFVQLDLSKYRSTGVDNSYSVTSDIGTVSGDTMWTWLPEWGSIAPVTATLAARNSNDSSRLTLKITVGYGDTVKPSLVLVDESIKGKVIGSPQIAVDCRSEDAGAGIEGVTYAFSGQLVTAVQKEGAIYSGIVSGLKHGIPVEVTVSALDKSAQKNVATVVFSITYDSTVKDAEAPTFNRVAGPRNGERVTTPTGSMGYSIQDASGIDSVWWKLNGVYVGNPVKQGDGTYRIDYELISYGNNRIELFARDKSSNKNRDSLLILLDYNTLVLPVQLVAPADAANKVSRRPVFTWSGGQDADGDSVVFTVYYGVSAVNLAGKITGITTTTAQLPSTDTLNANTVYRWQVTAVSKVTSDTVHSAIRSFTTIGVAPAITKQPASVTVNEGDQLELTATVSGDPACTYQWKKDGGELDGKTSSNCVISPVQLDDAGVYTVVATNSIGSFESNPATVTVTPTYTLTVNRSPSLGGSVSKVLDKDAYPRGLEVILTATANSDYRFGTWSGDITSTEKSVTVTMNKDMVVTANFVKQYVLTVTSAGNGTVGGSVTVDANKATSVTATAASGYKFKKWIIVSGTAQIADTVSANTTVTIQSDARVEAVFGCLTFAKQLSLSQYSDCYLRDGIQTEDGGYLVIAEYREQNKTLLIKLNPTGDTMWTKIIDLKAAYSIRNANPGYAIAGSSAGTESSYAEVLWYAQNGNSIGVWSLYDEPEITSAYVAMLSKENGYIIGGQSNSAFLLVTLDATKTKKMYKSYDVSAGNLKDCLPTRDGGYILVGGGCMGGCGTAVSIDANGEPNWNENFKSTLSNYGNYGFNAVDTTSDGYFAIAGTGVSSARGFVLTISPNKDVKSLIEYSDAFSLQKIKTTKNGGYFLAGTTTTLGNGGRDIYVIKANTSGTIVSNAAYGTSSDEEAQSLQFTSDGGIIIVGNNWVIKTDENGKVDP